MTKNQKVISAIDNLLNCDFEAIFEVKSLTDMPIGDDSLHYRMSKGRNWVDFGIFNGEMNAYTWQCPSEGRVFLKALEVYAKQHKLKLAIPTVLSSSLIYILKDNGYTMKEVPYMDDVVELWMKW